MYTTAFSPELTRDIVSPTTDPSVYEGTIAVLTDPSISHMAMSNRLTFGMIRPGLESALLDEGIKSDRCAAELVESEIQRLGIVLKFSAIIDEASIDEFYDGPPKFDSMLPKPPMKDARYANRWEEFAGLMTSGPATILLMESRPAQAVATWRDQLGHWNIEAHRDLNTIRGRHAIDNHNNLVHGSDSPESVIREIDIISRMLTGRISRAGSA